MGKKKKQEKEKKNKEKEKKLPKPGGKKEDKKERKAGRLPEAEKERKAGKPLEAELEQRPPKMQEAERKPGAEGEPVAKRQRSAKRIPEEEMQRKKVSEAVSENLAETAAVFRALGDESRLQILNLLSQKELCAGELLSSLSIVQSTLSHHMKILTESGIVKCKKQGKRSIYSIDREALEKVHAWIWWG